MAGIGLKPAIALLAAIVSFSKRYALRLVDQRGNIISAGILLNKSELPLVGIQSRAAPANCLGSSQDKIKHHYKKHTNINKEVCIIRYYSSDSNLFKCNEANFIDIFGGILGWLLRHIRSHLDDARIWRSPCCKCICASSRWPNPDYERCSGSAEAASRQ